MSEKEDSDTVQSIGQPKWLLLQAQIDKSYHSGSGC